MESVEERLKRLIECVKCPETGSEHFGEWGILTREQRLFLNNLARDTIDLLDCMDKKIRETQYKIEQGKMIELPCKVGDTVYKIMHVCGHRRIVQFEVSRISIYEKDICVFFHKSKESWHEWCTKPHHFGSNIFLTREEAEKRLKELQNGCN